MGGVLYIICIVIGLYLLISSNIRLYKYYAEIKEEKERVENWVEPPSVDIYFNNIEDEVWIPEYTEELSNNMKNRLFEFNIKQFNFERLRKEINITLLNTERLHCRHKYVGKRTEGKGTIYFQCEYCNHITQY